MFDPGFVELKIEILVIASSLGSVSQRSTLELKQNSYIRTITTVAGKKRSFIVPLEYVF